MEAAESHNPLNVEDVLEDEHDLLGAKDVGEGVHDTLYATPSTSTPSATRLRSRACADWPSNKEGLKFGDEDEKMVKRRDDM